MNPSWAVMKLIDAEDEDEAETPEEEHPDLHDIAEAALDRINEVRVDRGWA